MAAWRSWQIGAMLLLLTVSSWADPSAELLFVRRVAPLLRERCQACHGLDEKKLHGDLDLRAKLPAFKGGESGKPAIVAGKPEESPLYLAVLRTSPDWSAMPPKDANKLTDQELDWVKQWITAGAPWPDDKKMQELTKANVDKWSAEDGVAVKTSGGLADEWTNRKYKPDGLWAYQPIKRPPTTQKDSGAIDELIAQRLPAGLAVAPLADRRTLLRRVTFDLTGLPPTPAELDEFLNDPAADESAFQKVVDRLLVSPHFGERMAQHWLDVVRYADSSGFANDFERGNAWRYRDYLIRAFNSDKPFDQFIREQIAGDEIDPNDPEKLIAVGFLRMGPWELTGMEVAKVARQRFLDDVTNSVGETFLAHSLQCARCHDHKFDPVPTRDYYSIQAVFATTQLVERAAAFLPNENTAGFDERRFLEARRGEHLKKLQELDDVLLANAEQWIVENHLLPDDWRKAVEEARSQERKTGAGKKQFEGVFNQARALMFKQGADEATFPPKLVGFTPQQFGQERVARKGLERLRWEMDRYEPYALSVYTGRTPEMKTVFAPLRMPANRMTQGELEATCILTGGDPFASGSKVEPGVLSVLGGPTVTIPTEIQGRRQAFAEWVASKENVLTTRAIVNRVWMWHFGEPLAGNPNNFGSTGKKPTHPELLDWLADRFVADGWSMKKLHRLILLSQAYRRSTEHPDRKSLTEKDPQGTSLAVFKARRLSAEELRDAMLSASGELNRTMGGIPNRPEINQEAALQPRQVMGTFAAAWVPNPKPADRHRRSIYALKLRGLADPALEVFNAPQPDFSCERRDVSTVTPQVFAMFNSQASQARAIALATRVLNEVKDDDEHYIERCFLLTLGRRPRPEELTACVTHWRQMETVQSATKFIATAPPLEVRRDAVEENTGERFSFDEKLPANAEFVPDRQPADCDARTRALADVCLVLLNTNEFAYVY